MERLVLQDGEGRAYCGRCGATRNARGELFSELSKPEQGVRGHLKTCRGREGLEAKKAELAARLSGPPLASPDRLPASQPVETARMQPVPSRSQPASASYRPVPFSPGAKNHFLPAVADEKRFADLQGQINELRDQVTLARHESDRYRQIAEEALTLAGNHEPHLALAAAKEASVSPIVYVLGGIAAATVIALAAGMFGGATEDDAATMGRSNPSTRPSLGLGNAIDVGSKILGLVKNARGAFKV